MGDLALKPPTLLMLGGTKTFKECLSFIPSLTLYLQLQLQSILLPEKFFDSFERAEQAETGFVTTGTVASVKKRRTFSLLFTLVIIGQNL